MQDAPGYGYEGPDDLRAQVDAALHWVTEPQLAVDIVDAGLVRGVAVRGEEVVVRMTLTSRDCAVGAVIVEDVQAELFDHLGVVRDVRVEVVWDPPWRPSDMRFARLDALRGRLTAVKGARRAATYSSSKGAAAPKGAVA